MNIMANMEFLVIVFTVTIQSVLSVQMEWGGNLDLVKESDRIQGREHIKQLVLLEGESIDLECQVLFASLPVNDIRWRFDGKQIYPSGNSIVEETKDGYVFIENHYKIENISKTMDASSVNCEYEKGSYVGRLEACLNVFKLEIEISKKDYKTCKLIFKESTRRSQDEANVERRIRAKIVVLTNVPLDEITVQNGGYSVSMSLDDIKNNKAILAMQPKYIMDGNVIDSLDQFECDNDESQSDVIIGVSIVTGILVVIIVVGLKLKKRIFRRNCGSDDLDQLGFRACREKGCELCPHINKASGGKKVVTEVAIHQTGVKKCFSEGTMKIELTITCTNTHILYVLTCTKKKCMKQDKQYIGETEKSGVDMLCELEIECKNPDTQSAVGQHFQSTGHSKNDMEFVVVFASCYADTDRNELKRDLIKRYNIKDNMNEPEESIEMQFLV